MSIEPNSVAPEVVSQVRPWRPAIDLWLLGFFIVFFMLSIFLIYESGPHSNLHEKQMFNYLIAFVLFVTVSQIPINILKLFAPYFYFIGIVLLVIVNLWGIEGKGAQRWIDLGVLNLQPSEFFKFLLPMMLAWWLNLADEYGLSKWITWGVVSVVVSTAVVLIAIQPDLGSSLMVLMSGLIVVFLAGLPWKVILTGIFTMILSFPILWSNMHNYQKQRMLTFLDPYQDPLGSGYHVIQSMIAIGSGGWLGSGWLQGSQSRLDFVPEQHTDFIFSVVAEEFGLIGSSLLIALYFALMWRGLVIALSSSDYFSRVLGATLSFVIFIYTVANIGMVIGLLPVVGLPLPLISYGGSSSISYGIILGVISSIKCHSITVKR